MYLGTSFLALPLGRIRFCIDKCTWSPTLYSLLAQHFLLALNICLMQFVMIASWAAIKSHFTCKATVWHPWTWCQMRLAVWSGAGIPDSAQIEWIWSLCWCYCSAQTLTSGILLPSPSDHSQNLPYRVVCLLCCAIHLWMECCWHE